MFVTRSAPNYAEIFPARAVVMDRRGERGESELPEEIVCSPAELDVVGDALGLEVRRFPFTIGYHGSTSAERVRLVETVHRDLRSRGLVEGSRFAAELT